MRKRITRYVVLLVLAICPAVNAQDSQSSDNSTQSPSAQSDHRSDAPRDVLSKDEWRRVDAAVNRALTWLAAQQQPNGSFPTLDLGQPGVTSLCVLAFMAHGHNPGDGPYGQQLQRATAYIMSAQKDNGLISLNAPVGFPISRSLNHEVGVATAYNHAIASLTLSEIYGMGQAKGSQQLHDVITKSLATTLLMQRWPKDRAVDYGGWRYVNDFDHSDSDLSITGWNLMFLRSARNAGFEVPKEAIDDAVAYVRRSFDRNVGVFGYIANSRESYSRAMAGAGILALAHAGFHNSFEAQTSGKWLMGHSFVVYNGNDGIRLDRYHYSLFNSCQAMYQLGGQYWEQFFPPTVRALLTAQGADGSWQAESMHRDRVYGNAYTTGLVVLSLGAPNQLLPIFQR